MDIQSVITSSLEKIFPEQTPAACSVPFSVYAGNETGAFSALCQFTEDNSGSAPSALRLTAENAAPSPSASRPTAGDATAAGTPSAFTMLKKDTFSFQLALRPAVNAEKENEPMKEGKAEADIQITVESPLPARITLRRVVLMPSELPVNDTRDGNILSARPGLYPDLLAPLADGKCSIPFGVWTAFWVEIEAGGDTPAGIYPVRLRVRAGQTPPANSAARQTSQDDSEKSFLLTVETHLEVIDAVLPPQKLIVSEWFHGDCIADYYHIPVFSDLHWEYMRRQIRLGVRRGLSMILTPLFTPPLDTEAGGERTTIQLVDVKVTDDTYSFDFARLRRWVAMCLDCGIQYFEMVHLYTQWGAAHCPKIMVTKNGKLEKRFGWESDALGEDYRQFLLAFLPALTAELDRLHIRERTVFHISDEPDESCITQYRAAKEQTAAFLKGFPVMDAMSYYPYFTEGICETPVIATDALEPFLAGECPKDLWVYYCCAQNFRVSNRFFGMPSARNRIIGLQLYKYRVKGFLHWGFNFYNSRLSRRHIDPFTVTDADGAFPSGDAFLVYPGPDGEPLESIRMAVFYEALCDLRALLLLEQLTSREYVLEQMEGGLDMPVTFTQYPTDAGYLLALRERVNREIARFSAPRKMNEPGKCTVFCHAETNEP